MISQAVIALFVLLFISIECGKFLKSVHKEIAEGKMHCFVIITLNAPRIENRRTNAFQFNVLFVVSRQSDAICLIRIVFITPQMALSCSEVHLGTKALVSDKVENRKIIVIDVNVCSTIKL